MKRISNIRLNTTLVESSHMRGELLDLNPASDLVHFGQKGPENISP